MLTDGISTALASVATGIIVFWGALVAALTALVLRIVGALSSAATIVGLPASPFIAAGAATVACAAVIARGMNLESVCSSAATTLRQKVDDSSSYHRGHWPPAGTY